jgi:hypothetical protein
VQQKKQKKVGCVVALEQSAAKKTKEGWLRCSVGTECSKKNKRRLAAL